MWSHTDEKLQQTRSRSSFVSLLVIVVISNVAGPQIVSLLLLDIENKAAIAHQLSVGIFSIVGPATGPKYVRYILITTQLI